MVECVSSHAHIYQRAMLLVEQVKVSKGSPLITCLLEGPSGRYAWIYLLFSVFRFLFIDIHVLCLDSGKTSLAATIGINSDFPYVKIVSGYLFSAVEQFSKSQVIHFYDFLFSIYYSL